MKIQKVKTIEGNYISFYIPSKKKDIVEIQALIASGLVDIDMKENINKSSKDKEDK